jgi:hypothetical protein
MQLLLAYIIKCQAQARSRSTLARDKRNRQAAAGHYDSFGDVALLERAQGQFYVVRIIFD